MTKERVVYKLCTMAWKLINFKEPKMLVKLFPTNITDSRLRSSKDISKVPISKKFTTRVTCKRFSNSVKVFNDLPREIRDIKNLDCFKKNLKTHIFKQFVEHNR